MIEFGLWKEAFVFIFAFSLIIIIPCVLVALMGRKMIDQIGRYPTKTPVIQMSIFIQLIVVEVVTFFSLYGFYQFFLGQ